MSRWPSLDERVDRSAGPDGCWPWIGEHDRDGYGRARVGQRRVGAHRLALEAKLRRPLAPGTCACHTCDNPPCCNPRHLFEGTRADNNRDMRGKGRLVIPRDVRNGQAKLCGSEVLEIRDLAHVPDPELAARFGVHPTTIAAIQRGERYARWTRPGHRTPDVAGEQAARATRDAAIRELVAAGASQLVAASRFGISQSRVSQIVAKAVA